MKETKGTPMYLWLRKVDRALKGLGKGREDARRFPFEGSRERRRQVREAKRLLGVYPSRVSKSVIQIERVEANHRIFFFQQILI